MAELLPTRSWSPGRALVVGALVVGVLDGLDAVLFFGLRGVPPLRVGQGIAAGLLGRAAFAGGVGTALLGAALHFAIATAVVGVYLTASRIVPTLARRPLLWGPLYGLGVWVVMNYIVLPLSAAGGAGPGSMAVVLNGLLIHALGVGLPAALVARAAAAPARARVPQPAPA
jgi:hypothetical protein